MQRVAETDLDFFNQGLMMHQVPQRPCANRKLARFTCAPTQKRCAIGLLPNLMLLQYVRSQLGIGAGKARVDGATKSSRSKAEALLDLCRIPRIPDSGPGGIPDPE
jgi:hypothetical protein